MNKKLLSFSFAIIFIILIYFAIADTTIFLKPADNEIIDNFNDSYEFNVTLDNNTLNSYRTLVSFIDENITKICNISNFSETEFAGLCDISNISDGIYNVTFELYNGSEQENYTINGTSANVLVDSSAPIITLLEDSYKFPSINVTLSYLPYDLLLSTCILYGDWNENSTWEIKNQTIVPLNNSNNTFAHTVSDGTYNWNVWCNDTLGKSNFSEDNFSFSAGVPEVTLISPGPSYWTSNASVSLSCSATDNSQLVSISLYGNWTGWHSNETKNITGTSNSSVFTKTLAVNKIYTWSCGVMDNASLMRMAGNRTLAIDTEAPSFVYTQPVDERVYEYDEDVICNCSATDNLDPDPSCSIYNGSCSSSSGTRNITFRAWDEAGNEIFRKITYTVEEEETEAEEETTGGGGGGSSEAVSLTKTGDVSAISDERCWSNVKAGESAEYDVDNTKIGIEKITFVTNKDLNNICLEVKQVVSPSLAGITLYSPSEKVYKYFKIIPARITDSDLSMVVIEFSVSKTWLYNHARESVELHRYRGEWMNISVEDSEEDTDFVYFLAETPGFSDFVITADVIEEGVSVDKSCGNAICEVNENSTNCCQDCGCPEGSECKNNKCSKPSSFFITGWFSAIGERIKMDWLGNKWLLGLPAWSFIVTVIVIALVVLAVVFRKKIHLKFPSKINLPVGKKPGFGFK